MTQSDYIRYMLQRQAHCEEGGYPMECRIADGVLTPLPDVKAKFAVTRWWEATCDVCDEVILYGTVRDHRGDYIPENIVGLCDASDPATITKALCAVHYREACEVEYWHKIEDQCG